MKKAQLLHSMPSFVPLLLKGDCPAWMIPTRWALTPIMLRLLAGVVAFCCAGLDSVGSENPNSVNPKVSHISLPIRVDFSVLEKAANAQVSDRFDLDLDQDAYGVHIDNFQGERSDFSVECSGDALEVLTRISGRFALSKTVLSKKIALGSVNLVLDAGLVARPVVNTNWGLELNASSFCRVRSIRFDGVSVTSIPKLGDWIREKACQEIREKFLSAHVQDLAEQVAKDDWIRTTLDSEMRTFSAGVQLSSKPDLWLHVEPVSLLQPEFSCNGESLICRMGMEAIVTASLTRRAAGHIWQGLPPVFSKPPADELLIHGELEGSLSRWEELLVQAVVGTEIDLPKKTKLRIKGCQLEGRDSEIAVHLSFTTLGTLKTEGEMVLAGQPKFDSKKQEFFLDHFDFDLKTRDLLANTAVWALHETIRKRVQEMARFNIAEEMGAFQILPGKGDQSFVLAEGVTLKSRVKTLEVSKIFIDRQKLVIAVVFRGTGIIRVEKLEAP